MAVSGNDSAPARLELPVTDHPAAIGAFAEVLAGRNVGVGVGRDGQVILARPDSALIAVPRDKAGRTRLAEVLTRNELASPDDRIAEAADDRRHLCAQLDHEPVQEMCGEPRRSLSRVGRLLADARAARLRADLNPVVLGAQVMKGNPLGTTAGWIGDMAFPGELYFDELTHQHALLSSAEPAVAPLFRRARQVDGGRPPRVLILDTGLSTTASDPADASGGAAGAPTPKHPWLQDCKVHAAWSTDVHPGVVDDEDETFDPPLDTGRPVSTERSGKRATKGPQPSQLLDFEAGHGTFIAGVVQQICPYAEIHSAGVLSSFGDGDAEKVLHVLRRMQADEPFDLVVMSFGTNLLDDEGGVFGERLMDVLGDSLCVAAAGNQATCRPYFPAALPGVIGVGALAADGKAWFSNFGGWVDACAPGVDVVSTFFNDFTEVLGGKTGRRYMEWARWSGTSFSAPKVAAVIAQEMYLYGGSAKEAWKRLTSHKHFRYPDLGIVFNV